MAAAREAKPLAARVGQALDRAMAVVAPRAAAKRMVARQAISLMAGAHTAARRDRPATRNWKPGAGSAAADINPDLATLRARSRDAARNVMVAGGAIQTMTTHTLGLGLTVKPTVDREALGMSEDEATAWAETTKAAFADWCSEADHYERDSFADLQELAFRSMLESGDVFVRRRFDRNADFGLRLQVLEADHVCNPGHRADTARLQQGVQLSTAGVPQGYFVAKRHPGDVLGRTGAEGFQFVRRRGSDGRPLMLHIMQTARPGQVRGLPYLTPVLDAFKQLGDYTDAELVAAVNAGRMLAFVTTELDPEAAGSVVGAPESAAGVDVGEYESKVGTVVGLRPGETVDFKLPGRPNPQFEGFVRAVLMEVAVALGLPYELLLMRFTASYSASKAALEMAWHQFRKRRAFVAEHFCGPVYRWWLVEAVARGIVSAPGFFADPRIERAYLRSEWVGPSRMSLDPLKEANADAKDVALGVKSRADVIAQRTGGTFSATTDQLAHEERTRRVLGLAGYASEGAGADAATTDIVEHSDGSGADSDDDSEDARTGGNNTGGDD